MLFILALPRRFTADHLLLQALLPLDALKIKRQVNPEAFRGRGVVRIFMEEGTTLYRGWGWTMARNAPGSFAVCPFPVSFPYLRTLHPIIISSHDHPTPSRILFMPNLD